VLLHLTSAFGETGQAVTIIENFFGLVNDQVVTLPTRRVSSLVSATQRFNRYDETDVEETSDTFAALDTHNREIATRTL
jgi:hypothetical protein